MRGHHFQTSVTAVSMVSPEFTRAGGHGGPPLHPDWHSSRWQSSPLFTSILRAGPCPARGTHEGHGSIGG